MATSQVVWVIDTSSIDQHLPAGVEPLLTMP